MFRFIALACVALMPYVVAASQSESPRPDKSISRAKNAYDAELDRFRKSLIDELRRQAAAITSDASEQVAKREKIESAIAEIEQRGAWECGNDEKQIELDKQLRSIRQALDAEYERTLDAAKTHGEPAEFTRALASEWKAFKAATHLAGWKRVEWDDPLVALPSTWTRFGQFVKRPADGSQGTSLDAARLTAPGAGKAWLQLECEVDGRAGFRLRALDWERRPLDVVVTREQFAELRDARASGDGVKVRWTLQGGDPWHARLELDGRTVVQRTAESSDDLRKSWPEPADAEVPWFEVEPLAGAEVRIFGLQWRELSDVRPKPSATVAASAPSAGNDLRAVGVFGGRFGGRKNLAARGGSGTDKALRDAFEWLRWHQSEDGSWDCDGFMSNCGKIAAGKTCDGPGQALNDVGMTGLALLAFLGDGNTTRDGPYKEQVAKGLSFIQSQQDPDNGVLCEFVGPSAIYNHTIATLAVSEAYYFSKSPTIERVAQDAVKFLWFARSEHGVWRYDSPSTGDGDTSITGWVVLALKAAEEAGLQSDPSAFEASRTFFDEMTDPATGRCGYDIGSGPGSRSARVTGVNKHFPAEEGEAMSAISLLCRFFLGEDPEKSKIMKKQADLLRKKLPRWDTDLHTNDFYYWYYGSYAMYQVGGTHWKVWNQALKDAILPNQIQSGDEKGSWDPKVDAWGHAGGRVYTTALGALCLETYFRYARVFETR